MDETGSKIDALSGQIDALGTTLGGQIDAQTAALGGQIDAQTAAITSLGVTLGSQIDAQTAALCGQIDALSERGRLLKTNYIRVDGLRLSFYCILPCIPKEVANYISRI